MTHLTYINITGKCFDYTKPSMKSVLSYQCSTHGYNENVRITDPYEHCQEIDEATVYSNKYYKSNLFPHLKHVEISYLT